MATPDYNDEIWKTIEYAPDYAVSNMGRVRRQTDGFMTNAGKVLSQSLANGYPQVNVRIDGKFTSKKVHRLVADAFIGPKPSLIHQVAHKDGIRTNNVVTNLRWATPVENSCDDIANGVRLEGERHPLAKLSFEDITNIRQNYTDFIIDVAAKYGIDKSHVRGIIAYKAWNCHVSHSPAVKAD